MQSPLLDLWSQEQRRLQTVPEETHKFSLKTPVPLLDDSIGELHKTPIFLYGGAAPLLAKFIFDNFESEDGEKFWHNDPNGFVDPGTRCRLIVFDESFNSQDDARRFVDYLQNGPDMCFGIYLTRSGVAPSSELLRRSDIVIRADRHGSNFKKHVICCSFIKHRQGSAPNFGIEFPIVGGVVAHAEGKLFPMNNSAIDMSIAYNGRGKRLRDATARSITAQKLMAAAIAADQPRFVHKLDVSKFNNSDASELIESIKKQMQGRTQRSPLSKPWSSAPNVQDLLAEYKHYACNMQDDFPPPSVSEFMTQIENHVIAIKGVSSNFVRDKAKRFSVESLAVDQAMSHACLSYWRTKSADEHNSARQYRQYEWYVNCLFNAENGTITSGQIRFVNQVESEMKLDLDSSPSDRDLMRRKTLQEYVQMASGSMHKCTPHNVFKKRLFS